MCTDNNKFVVRLGAFPNNYIFYLQPEFGHHSWITKFRSFSWPTCCCRGFGRTLKGRTKRPGSKKSCSFSWPHLLPRIWSNKRKVEPKGSLACLLALEEGFIHILSHNVLWTRPKCFCKNVLLILMTIGSIKTSILNINFVFKFINFIFFSSFVLIFKTKTQWSSTLVTMFQ